MLCPTLCPPPPPPCSACCALCMPRALHAPRGIPNNIPTTPNSWPDFCSTTLILALAPWLLHARHTLFSFFWSSLLTESSSLNLRPALFRSPADTARSVAAAAAMPTEARDLDLAVSPMLREIYRQRCHPGLSPCLAFTATMESLMAHCHDAQVRKALQPATRAYKDHLRTQGSGSRSSTLTPLLTTRYHKI